jgi:hypothetical protein
MRPVMIVLTQMQMRTVEVTSTTNTKVTRQTARPAATRVQTA